MPSVCTHDAWMVTDRQYRRLMKLIQEEQTLATAAAKAEWMRKRRGSIGIWRNFRAKRNDNGHGERERMRSWRYGRRFWRFWNETKRSRPRRYSSIWTGNIQAGIRRANCGHCKDESKLWFCVSFPQAGTTHALLTSHTPVEPETGFTDYRIRDHFGRAL